MTTSENAPRYLIVRLSAIGDTVHTLPLAAALRRLRPDCHLGWVVEAPSAALIRDNPLVDWCHVLPKGWLKSPTTVLALRRELREQRFDMAFDVQGLTKSAVAAFLSGAQERIGFTRGEARELAPLLDTIAVRPMGIHAVDKTLSLLEGSGLPRMTWAEFVLPEVTPAERERIDTAIGAAPFILMGPWGSFPSKLWPLERFGQLAEKIKLRTGMDSLVLGHGDEERARVEELAGAFPDAILAAPDVSLIGVAELARRAALFVGCDSFPMHAAAAVGCKTIGLFGVTDPERLGPYGARGRAVYERLTLVKSTRERRRLGPDNLLALGVDKVLDACLELLKTD